MSNEKIEHDGITALRIFLGQSEIISPKINEGEKDISWDGHLNFFKQAKHQGKKNLLSGRIPIQVKCSNRNYKEIEKFSIEKADLNNYLNDGGILFIKSIYKEITKYKIYVKILLPLNIKEILSNSPADKDTVSVELKQIRSIEEFETYCSHFLENQPLQRNLKNYLNIDELKSKNTKLTIKTIQRKGKEIESLFSNECYIYKEIVDGISLPIDLKIESLGIRRKIHLEIDNSVFFENIEISKNRDGVTCFKLNSLLQLIFQNNSLQLKINEKEDGLFCDYLFAFRFLLTLSKNNFFVLNGVKINYSNFVLESTIENRLSLIEDSYKILDLFRINISEITLKELNDNFKVMEELIAIFIKNNTVSAEGQDWHFLKKYEISNKLLIVLFVMIEGSKFKAYNFMLTNPLDNEFTINLDGNETQCSRFLTLNSKDLLKAAIGYLDIISKDIISYFYISLNDAHQKFMLLCITCYDLYKEIEYLSLADLINEELNKFSEYQTDAIYFINKIQIIKRKRSLTENEKSRLMVLKVSNKHNPIILCCLNILLGYKEEFNYIFDTLSEDEQKAFKAWPILNLYNKAK